MAELRIIFMGTPEFAVASLAILVENKWPVVAVVTAPDRKKGRGQSLIPSPVKEFAVDHKIPVLQPTNLKSPEFSQQLDSFKANLQIVVAFRMLPEIVWNRPELGTFNLHASLLPNYRGAAPINWAIINGEKETGVTTFFLKHEIDTGSIILQESEPIAKEDTVGDLYTRLMKKGSKLVLKTVDLIAKEAVIPKPQIESEDLKHAPKIFKETCEIDWSKNAEDITNFVRGLNPYPTAWTTINSENWKIYQVKSIELTEVGPQGSILTDHKTKVVAKAADSWVEVLELQMPGKKRMKTEDLLRGNPLHELKSINQ